MTNDFYKAKKDFEFYLEKHFRGFRIMSLTTYPTWLSGIFVKDYAFILEYDFEHDVPRYKTFKLQYTVTDTGVNVSLEAENELSTAFNLGDGVKFFRDILKESQ